MFDFEKYMNQFNAGDDKRLIEEYFADDIVYDGANRVISGREAFAKFFDFAHDGVREIMRPQLVFQKDDDIFAEIDMDFYALKSRANFPFGELIPGQKITVKFFVIYKLREGKITKLKCAIWPPNYGVSQEPLLGSSPSQKASLNAYISALNAGNYDILKNYFTDDVTLETGFSQPIRGKNAIIEYHSALRKKVREEQTLNRFIANDDGIVVDITICSNAIEDSATTYSLVKLKKDESICQQFFIYYTLHDGLISYIRLAPLGYQDR